MKTLLVDAGYLFNPEDMALDKIYGKREAISRIYIAPEECTVKYDGLEKTAKKGDLIITFYEKDFPNSFVVIKSKEWRSNIEAYEKKEQEEKERWAKQKACNEDPCCDCNTPSCDC